MPIHAELGEAVFCLFVDCDDEVLLRRYAETRRRHPLAVETSVADAIAQQRVALEPLRDIAALVIDTSLLPAKSLQQQLELRFITQGSRKLTMTIESFSYRFGLPREADLVFDLRFLRNPHWDRALRPLDGRDSRVGAYIIADPIFANFFGSLEALILPLLPRWRAEGRCYLTIALGCTGGRHRSVFMAEKLAQRLHEAEFGDDLLVRILHRDVERQIIGSDSSDLTLLGTHKKSP